MKVLKQIWVLVIAVIFIIPAAGLTYNTHTCNMSGTTTLVLDQDYSCCAVNEKTDTSANCPEKLETRECCTNDSKYLKEQDEYTTPQSTQHFQFEIVLTLALLIDRSSDEQSKDLFAEYHPPPLLYNSKDLLFQQASLLL